MTLEEVFGELQDVFRPIAEWRDGNLDAVQPVEEIQPEPALRHQLRQSLIGRGNDPNIDAAGRGPAYAFDRHLLDGPQQFGLGGRRQIRDFVQKQRPFVRMLEFASPRSNTSRNPLLYPEQLRLQQRVDDGRTVDGHEWPVSSNAQVVNLASHQLLAGSGFAFNEYGEVGCGDAFDAFTHGTDAAAGSDDRRGAVRQGAHTSEQPASHGALDDKNERAEVASALEASVDPTRRIPRRPRKRRRWRRASDLQA